MYQHGESPVVGTVDRPVEPGRALGQFSTSAYLGQRFPFRFVQALARAFTIRYGLSSKDFVYFSPLSLEAERTRGGKEKREIFLFSDVKQKVCGGPNSAFDLFCIYLRKWFRLIFS